MFEVNKSNAFDDLARELDDEAVATKPTPPQAAPNTRDESIDIDLLQADDSIQQRAVHLDEATVQEYAESAAEWPFPPIVVFRDHEGRNWLADGFHRVEAALRTQTQKIPADIRAGDRDDAILYAVGANARHGLRRTNADKRKAVRTLLEHPKFAGLGDRAIAEYCAVHHQLVGTVRGEVSIPLDESSSQIDITQEPAAVQAAPKPSTIRTTKSGRKIDTAGIAASNKARAKTPPPDTAKTAQQALHRFMAACTDLRGAEKHLQQTELFKVAQHARDTLIWCFPKIADRDVAEICDKIIGSRPGVKDA